MATRPASTPARSGSRGSRARASKQPAQPPESSPSAGSAGRYRRTGWAFVVLALAVVTGLREWFGV
ncbi:hypothetical protein, partial [uncultured Actinomyces sp.]